MIIRISIGDFFVNGKINCFNSILLVSGTSGLFYIFHISFSGRDTKQEKWQMRWWRDQRTVSGWGAHLAAEAPARWPRRFCRDAPTRSCRLFWPDLRTQRCWPPPLCNGRNWSQTPGLWKDHLSLLQAWEYKKGKKKKKLQFLVSNIV